MINNLNILKKMKRYCYLILILAPIFTACEDWIDESKFTYAIATSTFYNTIAEADAAVMAPLGQMRSAYNANYFTTLEANTEYCVTKGSAMGEYAVQYNGVIAPTHLTRVDGNWSSMYTAIKMCNIGIQKIPEANAMTDEQKNAFVGELKFLRAFNYFHVVRRWGSVPLRTEANMEEWDLAKSPVDDVYNLIINDLKYALDNCPVTSRYIGTPNKNAVRALLAEVYMYRGEYGQAKTLTGEVINSNVYSLVRVETVRDFDKIFGYDNPGSTEEVFFIKTSRTGNLLWEYITYTANPTYRIDGKPMFPGNAYFTHYSDYDYTVIKEWDRDDLRFDFNLGHHEFGYGPTSLLLIKFWDPISTNSGGGNINIPLIRYADVLITYAEATARVAGAPTEESIETINKLRRRGYGYDPNAPNPALDYKLSDYNTMDKFIDLLIREDRYERMNEGKHWDFIVRLGKAQELIGNYLSGTWVVQYQERYTEIKQKHYLWRIPDSELLYNKALDARTDQNPGYND